VRKVFYIFFYPFHFMENNSDPYQKKWQLAEEQSPDGVHATESGREAGEISEPVEETIEEHRQRARKVGGAWSKWT
jgi:hypothetical protein